MAIPVEDQLRIRALEKCVQKVRRAGLQKLEADELVKLVREYRAVSSTFARLKTAGTDRGQERVIEQLLSRAHGVLFRGIDRSDEPLHRRLWRFFMVESPRTLRQEWPLLCVSFGLLYGLAIIAFIAVQRDLGLAYSLLEPTMVAREISQLESTPEDEPFVGNFDFGIGASPTASVAIFLNNIRVAILFFGAGLIPPLFVLVLGTNALMVGTYLSVAHHWGRLGEISSILWCHGVLELQAFVIAGAAGFVCIRAWIAPGPRTRSHAMTIESRRAWRMVAPTIPILVIAGLIEGFVSPHAPTPVRIAVAVATGLLLLSWILFCGRGSEEPQPAAQGG